MSFEQPQDVDQVSVVFGADALSLMPPYEECVEGLKALPREERKKWEEFQSRWFFEGLPDAMQVRLHEGIDGEKAFRHLGSIQGSFAPKHEHKEAAVAYLASRWFSDVALNGFDDDEAEAA